MQAAHFRPATPQDAPVLAVLVNEAGHGMPLYLWSKLASPGESAWEVGRKRAAREEGAFSYRNTKMIEHDGEGVGCLIGYEIADPPEPIAPNMPPMFRPLQELENLAPGTWYVNVLAVLPQYRNMGFGAELLRLAEEIGRRLNKRGMSVIVSDANAGARSLYRRTGYRETATRKMVKNGWDGEGENWVLMTKWF